MIVRQTRPLIVIAVFSILCASFFFYRQKHLYGFLFIIPILLCIMGWYYYSPSETPLYVKSPGNEIVVTSEEIKPKVKSAGMMDVADNENASSESDEASKQSAKDFEAACRRIFELVDRNADGMINPRELLIALRRKKNRSVAAAVSAFLGLPTDIQQEGGGREAFENIFQGMDVNGDRKVSWVEF